MTGTDVRAARCGYLLNQQTLFNSLTSSSSRKSVLACSSESNPLSLNPFTTASTDFLYKVSAFLFFGSRWKLVFKSWMGIRGLPRRLWFSLESTSPERDSFLLGCIKITFTYSYLMENFSLVSSHNLLENPLLFSTEITNLLLKTDSR